MDINPVIKVTVTQLASPIQKRANTRNPEREKKISWPRVELILNIGFVLSCHYTQQASSRLSHRPSQGAASPCAAGRPCCWTSAETLACSRLIVGWVNCWCYAPWPVLAGKSGATSTAQGRVCLFRCRGPTPDFLRASKFSNSACLTYLSLSKAEAEHVAHLF